MSLIDRSASLPETSSKPAPVDVAGGTGALAFGLALALNAIRGVGQGVESGHGDVRPAAFTDAELPIAHPFQGVLDARQFAAFHFRQLRTDFVLDRIQGGIDHVAGSLSPEFFEQTQVARQGLAQGVAPFHEKLAHAIGLRLCGS